MLDVSNKWCPLRQGTAPGDDTVDDFRFQENCRSRAGLRCASYTLIDQHNRTRSHTKRKSEVTRAAEILMTEFETPVKTSDPVIFEASPMKSGRLFDERLSSRLSQQMSPAKPIKNTLSTESSIFDDDSQYEDDSNFSDGSMCDYDKLQWMKLSKISETLFTSLFEHEYGKPVLMSLSTEYIVFATSKQNFMFYNYNQTFLMKIETHNVEKTHGISSLSLSLDSTYLVAGYTNGHINLWDLKKSDPIISIKPVTLHEIEYNGKHHHVAHQENTKITRICFVGSRHTAFVSCDENGMLIYHNGGRSLLGYYSRSKVVVGSYNLSSSRPPNYSNTILDCQLLPIGSKPCVTDTMSLLTLITPHGLAVISLYPDIVTHFSIAKPKILDETLGMSGSCAWFPANKDSKTGIESPPALAYAWSNILNILDLETEQVTSHMGETSLVIRATNKRRVKCAESIVSIHWLTSRILLALTKSEKLYFFDNKTLDLLMEVDLHDRELKYLDILQRNGIGLVDKSYFGCLKTIKSNIVLFTSNEAVIGYLSNWADILIDLLGDEKYMLALKESKRQYDGCRESALLGLPYEDNLRHDLMRSYLLQIVRSSLKYMFIGKTQVKEKIVLLLQTCISITAPIEIYDLLYEKLFEIEATDLFFECLENFIYDSEILSLSPTILRAMVVYYTSNNNTDVLEQLICLLDIGELDIDLALTLCQEYHLNEIQIYIWTTLLHDYFTPLLDAVNKIRKILNGRDKHDKDNGNSTDNSVSYIFTYMSYILTGRQYPTDKLLLFEFNPSAKLNIYYFLFNGNAIVWPPNTTRKHTTDDPAHEPAFPYLVMFLKYDSTNMFSSLNEAFEDDLLNDNDVVSTHEDGYQLNINRQYIIDVLLTVFDSNRDAFNIIDNIRLSVFISRNYPKFPQFIRIADSISEEMITLICKAGMMREDPGIDDELIQDCQLALRTILSIYKPVDTETLLLQVEEAKYYEVLLSIYQTEEMYIDVLKLWIKLQGSNDHVELFKPIPEIIVQALKYGDKAEKKKIIRILSENLEMFVSSDTKNIAEIVCTVCPEINENVIKFRNSTVKFEYLKEIFNLRDEGKEVLQKTLLNENLQLEYLKSLIRQRNLLIRMDDGDDSKDHREIKDRKNVLNCKIRDFLLRLNRLDAELTKFLRSPEIDEGALIVDWYCHRNEYENGMNELGDLMLASCSNMLKNGYTAKKESSLWILLNSGFSLVTSTNKALDEKDDNGTALKEKLLLKLIELSVKLLGTASTDPKNDKDVINLFKKIVQSTFTYIVNISLNNEDHSFSRIFQNFLDGSSIHMTTLGDVRNVLREIFISYSTDQEIVRMIKTLIDEDIFKNFQNLEQLKIRGWSPKNSECELCGKKVWGVKIGNKKYEDWRDYKLGLQIKDSFDQLYVFQCRHSYHTKCLENMGMHKKEDKKCILCDKEIDTVAQ